MPRGRHRRQEVTAVVEQGAAALRPDPDRAAAWTLLVDGTPQSHVDLADPTFLDFDYMRRLALVIDLTAPDDRPPTVLHLGGAAMTLPRYVAATRPGARQKVFETDVALTALVRSHLPLPPRAGIRVSPADARDGVARTRDATADIVIVDAFAGARTPAHLTTVEFLRDVARILAPGGVYAANSADGSALAFARGQAATALAVFANVCLIADPGIFRGRRFGNLVLVASDDVLPLHGLVRGCSRDPVPARVLAGDDLRRWVGTAPAVTDATAEASPMPPASVFTVPPASVFTPESAS